MDNKTYLELGKVLAELLKYCDKVLAADDEGVYLECVEIPEEVRRMNLKYIKVWEEGEE
ncbi:hypothetical protein [Saccharolobus islandicus]|nr:hypothetical protein [Sulfolobus islandicus]